MEKRYQVFVSSTYADLKDERRAVIQTLMEMDCIPAGMELFPAADETQWEFIKRVIDDCDYYVLIIGGRYGSTSAEGLSYTEQEYDYAVSKELRVLAFVHDEPETLPEDKVEEDAELRARLAMFRGKVMTGRLVKPWKTASELPGLVALSLGKTIKAYPAVGWVRGDQVASKELLSEVNSLRKANDELRAGLATARNAVTPRVEKLARLDETVTVHGMYWAYSSHLNWSVTLSWSETFRLIAPLLLGNPSDAGTKLFVTQELFNASGKTGTRATMGEQDFQTLKVQFMALGFVDVKYIGAVGGGMGLFWLLTPLGRNHMFELRAVRSGE
jgi:hypothetical protein